MLPGNSLWIVAVIGLDVAVQEQEVDLAFMVCAICDDGHGRFSVGVAKAFAGDTPLSILEQVRRAGFKVAHYNMVCSGLSAMPDSIEPAVASAVADAASQAGVEIAGVSGTYNMIHPDPAYRQRGLARLRVIAGACTAR